MVFIARRINTLISQVWNRAGPEKAKSEDAFLLSSQSIAVADGVGGWSLQKVDPSLYSNLLISNFEKAVEKHSTDIRSALISAAKATNVVGSSTFTGAVLHPKLPKLVTANIGDSGFSIWRKYSGELIVVERSEESTHDFNFPYQLGTGGDSPTQAHFSELDVEHGDLLIMYSDGFSDNLFESQVKDVLEKGIDDLQTTVTELGELASKFSLDGSWKSPFSKSALSHRLLYSGGKPDDITLILAKISISSN